MITNHHEITRSDLVQESLSNLPLGSFYLHRNIWQQTRHFLAVIQHVIFTHIRWWQPLFTPPYAHEWWPAKQNFKWAQVWFYSFSHSHVHQYNWKSFKPSQTRLFAAFRQFVLNCLVLPLYCPSWWGRVSCSEFSCQFPRTDPPALSHHWQSVCHYQNWFFWEFPTSERSRLTEPLPLPPNLVSRLGRPQPILTTCQPSPDSVSVSHKGLIRWNPSLDIQMDLLVLVEMPRVFLFL